MINLEAWNELPTDLQNIVKVACQASVLDSLSEFTFQNGVALSTLLAEHDVQLRRYPDDVLQRLNEISDTVTRELADNDELSARIYESFSNYLDIVRPWTDISDRTLLNIRPEYNP